MYKAVFIDIDGTLLKTDHSISHATIGTIKKLKDNNVLVVLVSARPLHGMFAIIEQTGLKGFPVVSLNGACITIEGKTIFDSRIDTSIIARIHGYLQQFDATSIYYEQMKWFAELKNFHTDFEQKITTIPITIEPFNHTLQIWQNENSGPNKILIISDIPAINKIQNNLKPLFIDKLNIYTSKPTYLEVINIEASKLNALKSLINHYNIKRENTIAIGDNFNDKEMIAFAGIGIAMGNAPDEVKAAADYITDTNDNDGVSKALAGL